MLKKAQQHLSKDLVMAGLIKTHGAYEWSLTQGDLFSDLVSAIIGQQLSTKAAKSILSRFKNLLTSDPMGMLLLFKYG